MNLFNRFIGWLAYTIKPSPTPVVYRNRRGKIISRVHAVQLKREKATQRLFRWARRFAHRR